MLTLRYFDNVQVLADLDESRNSVSLRPGPIPPPWAELAGVFAVVGCSFVAIARISGDLHLIIESIRFLWADVEIQLTPLTAAGSRKMRVSTPQGSRAVVYFPEAQIAFDPTPVEAEDFDFGEFLLNLKADPSRAERIWRI